MNHARDEWYGEWQDDEADEIRKVSVIRDAVWLAFGEILHSAQDDPKARAAASPRLAAQQMPPILGLTVESSPDKIRGTLQHVQKLFETGEVAAFSDQVILLLSPGIEALARRIIAEQLHHSRRLWIGRRRSGFSGQIIGPFRGNHRRPAESRHRCAYGI